MSFFSGLKKIIHFGGASGRSGDGNGQGNRYKKLPQCLKMEQDPNQYWNFIGELGDGAFGKVYKVSYFLMNHSLNSEYQGIKCFWCTPIALSNDLSIAYIGFGSDSKPG